MFLDCSKKRVSITDIRDSILNSLLINEIDTVDDNFSFGQDKDLLLLERLENCSPSFYVTDYLTENHFFERYQSMFALLTGMVEKEVENLIDSIRKGLSKFQAQVALKDPVKITRETSLEKDKETLIKTVADLSAKVNLQTEVIEETAVDLENTKANLENLLRDVKARYLNYHEALIIAVENKNSNSEGYYAGKKIESAYTARKVSWILNQIEQV